MGRQALNVLFVGITTAVGLGIAWLADSGGNNLQGWPALPALALLAFAIQWLAFLPAYAFQTEHYYDLTGSATYCLLTLLALYLSWDGALDPRALLLAGLISIWYLRLGSFLFRRVKRSGKDGRFDQIKTRWPDFLLAWTLQGLWVFLTLLAALIAITGPLQAPLGLWAALGATIWLAGFSIEALADAQKTAFKRDPANRDQFIRHGLWAWSRHPNYFGEILLWCGICVIALPCFAGWQWLGLISPLFVALLLIKISGVPILERRSDEKWGENAEYQHYKAVTPVLMLRPPAR